MRWLQKSKYCMEADTGHKVSVQFTGTKADYTAWRPCQAKSPYANKSWEPILYTASAAAARRACELDAQQQEKAA